MLHLLSILECLVSRVMGLGFQVSVSELPFLLELICLHTLGLKIGIDKLRL